MENSRLPRFKYSTQTKKKLKPFEYFLVEDDPKEPTTFEDYTLLRKDLESFPVARYLIGLLGGRLVKHKKLP
jgi:hypothetical protein